MVEAEAEAAAVAEPESPRRSLGWLSVWSQPRSPREAAAQALPPGLRQEAGAGAKIAAGQRLQIVRARSIQLIKHKLKCKLCSREPHEYTP